MYESWFRFRRRPFSAAPRTEDYFPAEAAEYARKTTISCVQRSAGPALVIGSAGSGKTTSCQQFLTHFRTRTSAGMISCAGIATRRTFFQNLLFEIDRPYRDLDEGELRLSLVDYLTSHKAPKDGTVLIFDDAHELPMEQFEDLSMLSGLMRDNGHCVHLILSGPVRLEEQLSTPKFESFNQRIAARSYLEPFRVQETESYVRRQFERAGAMADEVFIDDALTAIHKCTGGTPRLVNQLCDHALVLGAAGGHTKLNAQGVKEAWSDLQHLPPPEDVRKPRNVEDVVEFGSLDDDLEVGVGVEVEVGSGDDRGNRSVHAAASAVNADEIAIDNGGPDCMPPVTTTAPVIPALADRTLPDTIPTEFTESSSSDDWDAESEPSVEHSFDIEPTKSNCVPAADASRTAVDGSPPRGDEQRLDKMTDFIDDYEGLPYPSIDPFAEKFDDEEVVIRRPSTMLNRLADRQPEVVSQLGQDMIASLDELVTDGGFLRSPEGFLRIPSETDNEYDEPRLSVTSFAGEDFSEPIPEPQLEREPLEVMASTDFLNREDQSELPDGDSGEGMVDVSASRDGLCSNDSVVDYADSGSYEITVDFDSPSAASQGAVEFQAAVDEIDVEGPMENRGTERLPGTSHVNSGVFDSESDCGTASQQEKPSREQVVKLAISPTKITAENAAANVDTRSLSEQEFLIQELPPREEQQVAPEIRVVALNTTDEESTKPRRRFKQLFSGLAER